MNLTHASSALLRWLGAVSTILLPGIAAGQTPSIAAPPDSLSLAAVYVRLHAGTPRIMAARAAAQAAAERVGPARRPPDPELQFALMNREIPGFGLSGPARHEPDPAHPDDPDRRQGRVGRRRRTRQSGRGRGAGRRRAVGRAEPRRDGVLRAVHGRPLDPDHAGESTPPARPGPDHGDHVCRGGRRPGRTSCARRSSSPGWPRSWSAWTRCGPPPPAGSTPSWTTRSTVQCRPRWSPDGRAISRRPTRSSRWHSPTGPCCWPGPRP